MASDWDGGLECGLGMWAWDLAVNREVVQEPMWKGSEEDVKPEAHIQFQEIIVLVCLGFIKEDWVDMRPFKGPYAI